MDHVGRHQLDRDLVAAVDVHETWEVEISSTTSVLLPVLDTSRRG
jgi:hypothetical protein